MLSAAEVRFKKILRATAALSSCSRWTSKDRSRDFSTLKKEILRQLSLWLKTNVANNGYYENVISREKGRVTDLWLCYGAVKVPDFLLPTLQRSFRQNESSCLSWSQAGPGYWSLEGPGCGQCECIDQSSYWQITANIKTISFILESWLPGWSMA